MFQTTRRRLALWYTAVTAILLLLFASGMYWYVRNTLIERIDDTLNHVVEVVGRSLVIEPISPESGQRLNIEASFRDNADTVDDDRIDLEWFSPTGELLWSTFTAPLDIPLHPNRTGETVQISHHQDTENTPSLLTPHSSLLLRQVTERIQIGRQVLGYLRVSHPWFEVTKPSQQLAFDLILGIGLMLVSVALCGWFLSGKAMEPVKDSYQRLKQFTADASHELRSPIALIQTNVQVALAELDSAGGQGAGSLKYGQQLKVVERLTKRLGRLVDDLLFLARQDSGIVQPQFSTCPLDALLIEVVEEQQFAAAEKKIKIFLDLTAPTETKTEDDWFTLQGDWNQLARLFTNLIGNAIHYTPEGGEIRVELQHISTNKELFSPPLLYGRTAARPYHSLLSSRLQVKVKDTGIGIPETALPHLFDRFYRVDPARTHATGSQAVQASTGSGLGLAIAAAIVANHQGQITAESTLGQGTIFTVTLPASGDA
ncbi:sensor histidine kinase [Chroococcidiopsis thermalis]|uniref:histidine kinase n=1 Tax=Chroococcidiopsis thermalis (strain PCC 7203) TaxID=251229 RepID=K9U1E3_CHRTP|nr:HAMP domain-containing sensor histidine kinase [Chroococcidiopsis thermalis]AFY88438.1 integral membrane sensor signal transduction histidine kinase [Chroococcidiopsis thermalis PCC 7203]